MRLTSLSVVAILTVHLAAQAPNDPSAWWKLDESTGLVASDSGPNLNNGTLVGFTTPTWAPAQFGNGLAFNGVGTYVNITPIGAGLPIQNRIRHSVTAWVNGPAQGDRRIYSEGDSVNLNPLFTLGSAGSSTVTSNKFRAFVRASNGGNRVDAISNANVFDGTWHHVAWVDNAGSCRIYVDGVLDSSWSYDLVPSMVLTRIAIGAVLRNVPGNYYSGQIDDLRIFPYCLTPNDINVIRVSNAPVGIGMQMNQNGASMDLNGEAGSPGTAAVTTVAVNTAFTLRLSSTVGGNPWELAGGPSAPIANYLALSQNILNVDIGQAGVFFLNSGFTTNFGNAITLPGFPSAGTTVTQSTALTAPATPGSIGIQFAVLDPSSADGLRLSQPATLVVQ